MSIPRLASVRSLLPLAAFALIPPAALAQTVGIHLVTTHLPERGYLTGTNPGVYFEAANGATIGIYRNSLGVGSPYGGVTVDFGPVSVTGGVVFGYQRHDSNCEEVWAASIAQPTMVRRCGSSPGGKTVASPLLSPSVRLPAVLGVTPRLTLIPAWRQGDSTALHMSIEWKI